MCECLRVLLRDNLRLPDRTHSSSATLARRETPGWSSEPPLCPPVASRVRLKRWKRRCGPARPPRPPSSLPIPPRTHSASRDARCVLTYWRSHVTLPTALRSGQALLSYAAFCKVIMEHKTSHKGPFFEIEIYTSSES